MLKESRSEGGSKREWASGKVNAHFSVRMPARLLAVVAQHATLAAICVRILHLYTPSYALLLSLLFVFSHVLANRLQHSLFTCSLTFLGACTLLFAVNHIAATCVAILGLGFAPVAYPIFLSFDPLPENSLDEQDIDAKAQQYAHALSVRYRLGAFFALAGSNLGYSLGESRYFFLALIPVHTLLALWSKRSHPKDLRVTFSEGATMESTQFEVGLQGIEEEEEKEDEEDPEDAQAAYRVETHSVVSQPSTTHTGVDPQIRAFLQATREEVKEDALSDVVMAGQDATIITEAQRSIAALARNLKKNFKDAAQLGADYAAMQLLERRFWVVILSMIVGGLWVATFSLERLTRTPGEIIGPTIVNLLVVALMFWRGRYVTHAYVLKTWNVLWILGFLGTFALLWAPPYTMAYLFAILEGVGYASTAFFPLEWLITAFHRSVDPYPDWAWLWTAFHCARVLAMIFSVLNAYTLVLAVVGLWLVFDRLRPKNPEDSTESPHFPLSRSLKDPRLRCCGLW